MGDTIEALVPVHVALSAVMGEVQAVGKNDHNNQQGFSFRGIDAVVNAVGPALRRHGVLVLPRVVESTYGDFTTSRGTVMHTATLHVEFTFVGPDGSTLTCSAMGESADAGDKATAKAHSVAFRTALLQALCIPTHEPDPDAQSYERVVEAVVPEDVAAELRLRLNQAGPDDRKAWMARFGVPPAELPARLLGDARAFVDGLNIEEGS